MKWSVYYVKYTIEYLSLVLRVVGTTFALTLRATFRVLLRPLLLWWIIYRLVTCPVDSIALHFALNSLPFYFGTQGLYSLFSAHLLRPFPTIADCPPLFVVLCRCPPSERYTPSRKKKECWHPFRPDDWSVPPPIDSLTIRPVSSLVFVAGPPRLYDLGRGYPKCAISPTTTPRCLCCYFLLNVCCRWALRKRAGFVWISPSRLLPR